MKITSAYANKMLRQLAEDKDYWAHKENVSCVYTAAINEQPVVPEYDYQQVADMIAAIDEKVAKIRHAINAVNVSTEIDVGGKRMTVDTVLVKMAQLHTRKNVLDYMRKQEPKSRKKSDRYSSRPTVPEYQYVNYDLSLIRDEFERVSREIMTMQMALDKHNQTFEFEIDL